MNISCSRRNSLANPHRAAPAAARALAWIPAALIAFGATAQAATITFNTDPFAGTNVLTTPGRQVLGGEAFLPTFDPRTDKFVFDAAVFGITGPEAFVNALSADIPAGGANIVVLEDFDDDANPLTPFGASNAANLIAGHLGTHGAGFFVYFNQGLNLPRLVYSTDLASTTSDLRILARVLGGSNGQASLAGYTQANFAFTEAGTASVPEPASAWLVITSLALCGCASRFFGRRVPGTR